MATSDRSQFQTQQHETKEDLDEIKMKTETKVSVTSLGKQIAIASAILFITSTTCVVSFSTPFSPSHGQRCPGCSVSPSSVDSFMTNSARSSNSVHSEFQTSARSKNLAKTSLAAVSMDGTEVSASDLDDEEENPKEVIAMNDVSKFRQLKDVMWIREALEDVTAAEFALSVEYQAEVSSQESPSTASRKTKKRAVDYEKLLGQLTKRIEDMTCQTFSDKHDLSDEEETFKLEPNLGMGRYAYSNEERLMLMEKILKTRGNLLLVLESVDAENDGERSVSSEKLKEMALPDLSATDSKEASEEKEAGGEEKSIISSNAPKLYVRDDGTVDWEGALQDRAALKQFGSAVWARINGQTPDELGDDSDDESTSKEGAGAKSGHGHHSKPAVTAKIVDTPAIKEARTKLAQLREDLKEKEKSHTALVQSGIKAGQAVANVKLASLDPVLRNKIRQSAEDLHILEQEVSYQNLVYELERIYSYLLTELGNPTTKGYIPLQDRLNVAEYGLLESQIENCSRELNAKGVLDADILAVITEQLIDFKRRLGIDYYVTGLTYDREAIVRWLNDVIEGAKTGLMFYVKGTRLFWDDLVYCVSLIGRAAQGVTLKPREVRVIRRNFKDIVTFIPFVIILLIPLSPIGHVLVFDAIRRFFPEFFPSFYTEERQNLLQLYEATEFSEVTIKETLQERLTRFLEALGFAIVTKTRNAYKRLANTYSEETVTDESTDGAKESSEDNSPKKEVDSK